MIYLGGSWADELHYLVTENITVIVRLKGKIPGVVAKFSWAESKNMIACELFSWQSE
jgi:hypothetical protein